MSLSWPRILPNGTGTVNGKGLEFYDRLVDGLFKAGVTPWITLFHWMTFNEPQMFLALEHVVGTHAPGMKYADAEMLRVCHHAFCAHGKVVQAIRASARQPASIGYAPAAFVNIPPGDSAEAIELARTAMFVVTK